MTGGKPYDLPDDFESRSVEEKQRFFHKFRRRVYWYWFKKGSYEKERQERVNSHKVTDTLE